MILVKKITSWLVLYITLIHIPYAITAQPYQPEANINELVRFYDTNLQRKLIKGIGKLGLWGPVRKKILGVAVLDMTPLIPRLATLNGEILFYAASIPKLAILWALFKKIEDQQIPLTKEIMEEARKMMSISSNKSATLLYKMVGPRFVLDLLLSPYYKFYDPDHGGGIWIGKEYGKGSAFLRDPIGNYAHAATALQVVRFYYLFDQGKLVSTPLKPYMESTLNKPELIHKFVKGLQQIAPQANLLRKSGSWGDMHADSALVDHDGKRYIVVAWMNHVQGYLWLEDIVKIIDSIVSTKSIEEETRSLILK
jgi:beta-lactamase class A